MVVGIEVFDRAADFDPKIDTVVRVEAGKLRKRLEEYYTGEGAAMPLRIVVPKGGYVPVFQIIGQTPAPAVAVSASLKSRYVAAALVLVAVAALSAWAIQGFRSRQQLVNPSIAVLPFLNFSGDAANDYFSDGMTEELTDALCKVGGLRVASRTSAFVFKGKQADVHEIGDKLHVAFVVEGSVRKQGPDLKVTTQLIRTSDGYHLWSESFERRLPDLFAVQQQIANSVASVLQTKLLLKRNSPDPRPAHAANEQAFDLYLRGKYALNSRSGADLRRAEELLNQSLVADTNYAPTYVALAELYMRSNIFTDLPAAQLYSKVNSSIHRALELDDKLADAHAMLGAISARHDHDFAAAERHLRRAVELNPNSSQAHYQLAQNVFAPQERWPEALAENRLASELDPLSGLTAYSEPWLAVLQRHHESAIAGFRKLVAASPQDLMAAGGLVAGLIEKGDYSEALKIQRESQRERPSFNALAMIGYMEGRAGNRTEAQKILKELLQAKASDKNVAPMYLALLYLGMGNADGAFEYLELARKNDDSAYLLYARLAPFFDPIRRDSRFKTLLTELDLSDRQIEQNQRISSISNR